MANTNYDEFVYSFANGSQQCVLRVPLVLPLDQSVSELTHRLITSCNLPCNLTSDLEQSLSSFVDTKLNERLDEEANRAVGQIKSGQLDTDKLLADWNSAFMHEVLEYSKVEPVSNEFVFSDIYHSLIHSAYLERMLNLEHKYSLSVGELIKKRDANILQVNTRQRAEMEEAVTRLGTSYADEQINQLAQRQFEQLQMVESRWASELSNLQETQRRDYRNYIMRLYESSQLCATPDDEEQWNKHSIVENPGLDAGTAASQHHRRGDSTSYVRREESFTVHLGAQMKTSHNLRLISADVLDFCKRRHHTSSGMAAQCLQTAISLYSNSLCGLVLLVDNRLNSYTGIKRDFASVCQQSTEFHLPTLEQQFESIDISVAEANSWRAKKKADESADVVSVKSSGSSVSSEEMTIPWCLKRAELMFKCIKGFIMELAMWSGQESFTIQFLVPRALSDEMFSSLSNMMPSIFRMSNPVVAKS